MISKLRTRRNTQDHIHDDEDRALMRGLSPQDGTRSRWVPLVVISTLYLMVLGSIAASGSALANMEQFSTRQLAFYQPSDSHIIKESTTLQDYSHIIKESTTLQEGPNRPNLIVIMTDQQRFDAMSMSGHPFLQTPNMDRIAREGAYFLKAYSQSPVCGPARSSFLTGLSIENTHVRTNTDVGNTNSTNGRTFDEYLVEEEGYRAEYHGKWHSPFDWARVYSNPMELRNRPYVEYLALSNLTRPRPEDMVNGTQIQTFNQHAYRTNPLDDRYGLPPGSKVNIRGEKIKQPHQHGVSLIPAEHTATAFDGKRTIDALKRLNQAQQPFSLYCSFFCPHAPITPSEPYASMYQPEDMIPPASIDDPMADSPYVNHNRRLGLREYADPNLIKYMMANYFAFVKEIDVWVGKILDTMDELGLTDNTLLVFTSDHGEMLGSHGMIEKNVFYEESVHVPLLMRFPGVIPEGTVVPEPVSHTDVFATILDYLGAQKQSSDGTSLRRLIERSDDDGEHSPPKDFAVSEWNRDKPHVDPGLMIRHDRWKLFLPTTVESKVVNVLFDLQSDPHELHNLLAPNHTGREMYLETAENLRAMLVEWLVKVNYSTAVVEAVTHRAL